MLKKNRKNVILINTLTRKPFTFYKYFLFFLFWTKKKESHEIPEFISKSNVNLVFELVLSSQKKE